VSVADYWQHPKLNHIASVSMSSRMFDEEDSQGRIRRSNTREHHERNGEAAQGKVRARKGSELNR
jgi:hypothetical protein